MAKRYGRRTRAASGLSSVELAGLWIAIVTYYFVTSPAGMTPLPVTAGWIVIALTVAALIVLCKRYPWIAIFTMALISALLSGGRRGRRW